MSQPSPKFGMTACGGPLLMHLAVVKVKGLQLQCMMGSDDRIVRRHVVHDL